MDANKENVQSVAISTNTVKQIALSWLFVSLDLISHRNLTANDKYLVANGKQQHREREMQS